MNDRLTTTINGVLIMKLGTTFAAAAALSLLASSIALAADGKTYKVGAAVYGLKGQFMQNWVRELKEHPAVKDGTVQLTDRKSVV